MLTLSAIKENPQEIIRRLAVKHFDAEQLINEILDLDKTRRSAQAQLDQNRSEQNKLAAQIGALMKAGNKDEAEKVMLDWIRQAQESKVQQLVKMAATIMAHRTGILAWYDCHISTGKVEGINNKIKVMKRTAYGLGMNITLN